MPDYHVDDIPPPPNSVNISHRIEEAQTQLSPGLLLLSVHFTEQACHLLICILSPLVLYSCAISALSSFTNLQSQPLCHLLICTLSPLVIY